MSALASSTYPVRSQQARAILIRPGDDADCFVSPTPSDPHKMGWGCTAIRGRKPTPRIGPSYSRCNPGRYLLSGTRRACKKGKPGRMSEPRRSLLLKRQLPSKSSKPGVPIHEDHGFRIQHAPHRATRNYPVPMRSCGKSGLMSAPRLPQTRHTNLSSISNSRR